MITFNYLSYEITIHDYMFCSGYKATLEEPGEESQYIIESLSVTKDGEPFDDFEFFEIINTTDFDKIAEKNIIQYEKQLRQ
jgi:hypothetical protein